MGIKKFFIFIFKSIIVIFAIIGFVLLAGYIAVSLHWTDTKGIIDEQTNSFWQNSKTVAAALTFQNSENDIFFNKQNYCFLKSIKTEYPGEFTRILNLAFDNNKDLAQKNLDVLKTVLSANNNSDFVSAGARRFSPCFTPRPSNP